MRGEEVDEGRGGRGERRWMRGREEVDEGRGGG